MVMTMVIMDNRSDRSIRAHGTANQALENNMQTMKASEFKAKCLRLMDEINRTGEEITITKNGKPVSILKPYRNVPKTLFGLHKNKIQSSDDIISPLKINWEAE